MQWFRQCAAVPAGEESARLSRNDLEQSLSYLECVELQRVDDVIRSGLALHASRLLTQYEQLTKDLGPAERYEATLTVCVLQTLVTNCWELWKSLHDKRASRVFEPLREYTLSMLADPEVEVNNSFPGQPDLKAVLEHVRNAVSHPRTNVTNPPTTGYTTVEDGTGYISRLCFTDSPDLTIRGALRSGALAETDGDAPLPRVFSIELPHPTGPRRPGGAAPGGELVNPTHTLGGPQRHIGSRGLSTSPTESARPSAGHLATSTASCDTNLRRLPCLLRPEHPISEARHRE